MCTTNTMIMNADETLTFSIEIPAGYFTLAEFNAWVERELNATKAAWVSRGNVFKDETVKQSTLAERVAKTFVKKQHIHLTRDMIRHSDYSNYISISGLNKLRECGVTELNITYDDLSAANTYKAVISMSAIEPNQNSISITFQGYNSWAVSGYRPNSDTKWGSYFKEED